MRAEHPSPLCAAPWVAMEFDPFGNVQACCANALHPLGNITRERLPEIWHGPRADALREALAAGDLTRGCDICRHRLHHPGGEIPLEYYNQFARPGAPTTWPRLLSFSLHNTCNLACVMCGADLSSKIRSTRSDLPPLPHVYGDEFFEDLVPFLVACEAIDFAGGEPFLVREHRRVWELLAELGVRPTTSVTTNGTVWNDHVEWVLDTFSPNICVSVDAMDPTTFEAVRVGARFDEVMANIERFEQQAEATGSGVYLSFSMTRHNWSELAPVLRFADEHGMDVSIQTVVEPAHGVQHLPVEELREVVATMERQEVDLLAHLDRNRDGWLRQLARLRAEVDERADGRARPLVMAPPGPATSATLDAAILDRCRRPAVDADERAAAAAALERWAGGRPTGQIQLDAEGRCTSLDLDDLAGLEELDLDIPRGAPFRTLLDQLEAELGASTWVAGEDLTGPIGDHHLWLTTGGDQRDKVGLRLRILACPVGDGADLLVATDTYLAPRATPVAVRARTADP